MITFIYLYVAIEILTNCEDFGKMKIADLRKLLKDLSLDPVGHKSVLLEELNNAQGNTKCNFKYIQHNEA